MRRNDDASTRHQKECIMEQETFVTSPTLLEWEEEKPKDWFQAFLNAVKSSLAEPSRFFTRVALSHRILRPWAYCVIFALFSGLLSLAWQFGFHATSLLTMVSRFAEKYDVFIPPVATGIYSLTLPFSGAIAPFVTAALVHFFLMIVGGAKKTYIDTFRVVCYASAPSFLAFIPFGGSAVSWIWIVILQVIGIKVVHGTTTGKSLFAVVLLPAFLCCLLFGVVAMIATVIGFALAG